MSQRSTDGVGLDELRREWRRLHHREPPRISRDLLIRGIGYRLQEIERGGLGKSTRRKLQTIAKALRITGRVGPTPSLSLKPGARLMREWHGRTHTVTVTEDGLTLLARLKRVGREMRLLVENSDDQTPADLGLLRIIARAHDFQTRLIANADLTVHDVAREERVSGAYIYCLLRLPSLAPDIVTAILNGRNPPQLTAKKLMRLSPRLPIDWTQQRKLLGFS